MNVLKEIYFTIHNQGLGDQQKLNPLSIVTL